MSCCLLLIPAKRPAWIGSNEGKGKEGVNFSDISSYCFSSSVTLRKSRRSNLKLKSKARRNLYCKCQLADLAPAASAAYGVLLLGGGLFAFSKTGSKGSLFGGLTGAALMATTYFLMQAQDTKAIGDALGFGSAFLFSSVFGIRLAASRKLVPAGALLALSICALAVFVSAYLQDSV